jgi:hypothetical protein
MRWRWGFSDSRCITECVPGKWDDGVEEACKALPICEQSPEIFHSK